jgi:hypothetical protein
MSASTPKVRKYLTIPVLLSNGKRKNLMIKTVTSQTAVTVGTFKGTTVAVTRQTPATKNGTPFIQ